MDYALLNVYAPGNTGDRAIVEETVAFIREHGQPDAKIGLVTTHVAECEAYYAGDPGLRVHASPWTLVPRSQMGAAGIANDVGGLLSTYVLPPAFASSPLKTLLPRTKCVISVGGGYLYSSYRSRISRGLLNALSGIVFAARLGCWAVLCPMSIGPFRSEFDASVVARGLRRTTAILCRDRRSLDWCRQRGLGQAELAPDMAVLLGRRRTERAPGEAVKIGITFVDLRNYATTEQLATAEDVPEKLRRVVEAVAETNPVEVTIYAHVDVSEQDSDVGPSNRLAQALAAFSPTVERTSDQDVETQCARYGASDLFIGSRLHSCLFALAGGAKVIALAYQPKHRGVLETLGLQDYVLDVWSFDPDAMIDKARAVLSGGDYPFDPETPKRDLECTLVKHIGL